MTRRCFLFTIYFWGYNLLSSLIREVSVVSRQPVCLEWCPLIAVINTDRWLIPPLRKDECLHLCSFVCVFKHLSGSFALTAADEIIQTIDTFSLRSDLVFPFIASLCVGPIRSKWTDPASLLSSFTRYCTAMDMRELEQFYGVQRICGVN